MSVRLDCSKATPSRVCTTGIKESPSCAKSKNRAAGIPWVSAIPKIRQLRMLADQYNTAALSASSRRYQEPRLFSARGFARDIPYGDEVASYIQDCVRVWKSSEPIRFWRRHHRIAFASNTSGDATLSGNQCPPCEQGGEASRCEPLPIDEGVVPVLSSAF